MVIIQKGEFLQMLLPLQVQLYDAKPLSSNCYFVEIPWNLIIFIYLKHLHTEFIRKASLGSHLLPGNCHTHASPIRRNQKLQTRHKKTF